MPTTLSWGQVARYPAGCFKVASSALLQDKVIQILKALSITNPSKHQANDPATKRASSKRLQPEARDTKSKSLSDLDHNQLNRQ